VPTDHRVAASSIRQIPGAERLPDFRNLGVLGRVLVVAIGVGALAAAARAGTPEAFLQEVVRMSGQAQLVLLLELLALVACANLLKRLSYGRGTVVVLALTLVVASVAFALERALLGSVAAPIERYWLFTCIVAGVALAYLNLRARALSPAIAEARLQALQARIRPHFLFNSLNAVLSLIRAEPRRAEHALEDMAELFRVVMADNRDLTPLEREVALSQQYLNLEQLRLGERLKVEWYIDKMPADAMVPPLVLQPLLENAVYHGIEPRTEPGVVSINIYRKGDEVHAVLRNPYRTQGNHHAGNKMALANIRERLQLHFDVEASLRTSIEHDSYQVHIVMPYRRTEARR
jgi:two-component system sensor histidine kinase AlgZ